MGVETTATATGSGLGKTSPASAGFHQTPANWAARTAGNDGDVMQLADTGAIYVYSSDFGDWVPENVQAGTVTVRGAITGAILPSAESPAWAHTTTGSATITTDGTHVSFTSTAAAADQCYATLTHAVAGGANWYMAGLVTVTGELSGGFEMFGRAVTVKTGARTVMLSFSQLTSSKFLRFYDGTNNTVLKASIADGAVATETLVELLITSGGAYARVGNAVDWQQASQLGDFAASGTQTVVLGDTAGSGGALTKVRDLQLVTF